MRRGAFIVLEGCDRAGKSTQAKMLAEALNRLDICSEMCSFPNRTTKIGSVINEYLTGQKDLPAETIHLLFSANRWECSKEIKKKLELGMTIISDRYAASGAAYSAVNTGRSLEWCKIPDQGLPAPDLVVYLRVDKNIQESRNGWGDERFDNNEFQDKVADNFFKLADDTWEIIDKGSIQEVHRELLKTVVDVIDSIDEKPIKKLYETR